MPEINILVIENDKESAKTLGEIIRPLNYQCSFITNPKELMGLIKTTPYAVILTELRMSYLDGVKIAQLIREVSPLSHVIVMTPYSFISSAVEAMEAGAHQYITKPFIASEIRIVIEQAVERYLMLAKEDKKEYYRGLSVKDGLTGVYNRRFLDVQLKNKIATVKGDVYAKFSILMIDIDDFKHFNDTQGHQAGDELLRSLTQVVKDSLRDNDLVFRYGGEEFCVMLDEANKKQAAIIADRIRTVASLYIPTTISIGVATFPDDAQTEAELISKADEALYTAKNTGKNKVVCA